MKKEEIPFLNQLVEALEEADEILEQAYNLNYVKEFNEAKKFMIKVADKIEEISE
ncbi:MAG: hypothetical protein ACE5ES_05775 [Candidatus Nanoarchaeia archaeon]